MTVNNPQRGADQLVVVEPDLATHVIDLLEAADVLAWGSAVGSLTAVMVPADELERARATIDLVLPGLLAEEAGELLPEQGRGRLSDRLIRRTDWTSDSPQDAQSHGGSQLRDGRAAFAEVWRAGPSALDANYDDDEDDDFVPPTPPPIPRGDTVSRFAWLGAIGGPILMVLTALLHLPSVLAMAGLAGFIVGFGVLVARMPDRAPIDDGPENGAVL